MVDGTKLSGDHPLQKRRKTKGRFLRLALIWGSKSFRYMGLLSMVPAYCENVFLEPFSFRYAVGPTIGVAAFELLALRGGL